jgi:hypothetical protein
MLCCRFYISQSATEHFVLNEMYTIANVIELHEMQKHWTYDGSANESYIEPYLRYMRTRKMYVFNLIGYELSGFPRRVDQNKRL